MRHDWSWDQAIDWAGFGCVWVSFSVGFLACWLFGG
jgi:hypothetical protein